MKAAVVLETGRASQYSEFDDPAPLDGEVCVTVTASALTHFTKVRAAGKHFRFNVQPPFVAGIDGVGKLDDGRRVYFVFPRTPYGGMAQKTLCTHLNVSRLPKTWTTSRWLHWLTLE